MRTKQYRMFYFKATDGLHGQCIMTDQGACATITRRLDGNYEALPYNPLVKVFCMCNSMKSVTVVDNEMLRC